MHPADHLRDLGSSDALTVLDGVRAMLRLAGRDPHDPGLIDTPSRFLRAWMEATDHPGDPAQFLGVTFKDAPEYDELIATGPVPFRSVCEHHLAPFTGHAWVAYIPGATIVGLSKLARLVQHHARQPQIQERLTTAIATDLDHYLTPRGSACIIRARHSCMTERGVQAVGAHMVTSKLAGAFKDDPAARAELFAIAQWPHNG